MSYDRRARPTTRCLVEDLGLELPELPVDLGEIDHRWLTELRRIAPTSPTGQKRILSIAHPVYRLRVSTERGATWIDDDGVVWLCAVRRREDGSDSDAFAWFAELYASDRLLPAGQRSWRAPRNARSARTTGSGGRPWSGFSQAQSRPAIGRRSSGRSRSSASCRRSRYPAAQSSSYPSPDPRRRVCSIAPPSARPRG